MGQPEVLEVLKSRKEEKLTVNEIAASLGVNPGSVGCNVKKMRKLKFSQLGHEVSKDHRNRSIFLYWYKEGN